MGRRPSSESRTLMAWRSCVRKMWPLGYLLYLWQDVCMEMAPELEDLNALPGIVPNRCHCINCKAWALNGLSSQDSAPAPRALRC